jgi:hypothetical protein
MTMHDMRGRPSTDTASRTREVSRKGLAGQRPCPLGQRHESSRRITTAHRAGYFLQRAHTEPSAG